MLLSNYRILNWIGLNLNCVENSEVRIKIYSTILHKLSFFNLLMINGLKYYWANQGTVADPIEIAHAAAMARRRAPPSIARLPLGPRKLKANFFQR